MPAKESNQIQPPASNASALPDDTLSGSKVSEGQDSTPSQRCGQEIAEICRTQLAPEHKAGLEPWYMRDDDTLDSVCRAGYSRVWMNNVDQSFQHSSLAAGGDRPTSWHALGKAVGRDPKGFTKYGCPCDALTKQGRQKPRVPPMCLRYRIACALGCEEHDLSPETWEWIASATRVLLGRYDSSTLDHISDEDLDAYGHYACSHWGEHDSYLDPKAIQGICKSDPALGDASDVEAAVLRVAAAVGSVLQERFSPQEE